MRRAIAAAALALAAAAACKSKPDAPRGAQVIATDDARASDAAPIAATGERKPGTRVAAGSLRDPVVEDAYAVLVPADADAERVRRAALAVSVPPELHPTIRIDTVDAPSVTPDLLRYFGRGLSDLDRDGIAKARRAVLINVIGPPTRIADVLHASATIARASAREAHGWIQDRYTNETFTPAAFVARRPDGFAVDERDLIVMHIVGGDDGVFFETYGLARFGLPELYMRGIPRSFAEDLAELVYAAAQTLIERGSITRDGELAVDLAALSTGHWAGLGKAVTDAGGSGKITFAATWSRGDDDHAPADAPEIELSLPGGPVAEQVHAAIDAYFGARRDQVINARTDDAELKAASARAKEELAALAPHFAKGVPDLERLIVKAPFTTDDGGVEWMWVEVQAWKGDRINGVLINRPDHVSTIKEGALVVVKQSELFDYLYQRADGTKVGNETSAILERGH